MAFEQLVRLEPDHVLVAIGFEWVVQLRDSECRVATGVWVPRLFAASTRRLTAIYRVNAMSVVQERRGRLGNLGQDSHQRSMASLTRSDWIRSPAQPNRSRQSSLTTS